MKAFLRANIYAKTALGRYMNRLPTKKRGSISLLKFYIFTYAAVQAVSELCRIELC